jgi:eukaryotic-like serine/threonine-protein kinase
MGAVYLAEHPGIGRKAAVKVLHAQLTQHAEIANRFFNEAKAANAIRHPGIIEVIDFGTLPEGASYIVMEFLEGESLASRIKRSPRIPLAIAIDYAAQAASALGAAHAKGIVHRDLKPDNLFVVPDARRPGEQLIKVLDFGIAKLGSGITDPGAVRTRTGVVMGTPIYMSPEQCRGTKEVDHRTDVYALGIILYEMLCGAPPFMSEGQGELIHLHISAPPPPLRSRTPDIPAHLEAVVLRALAKDPVRRFQSMAEIEQALKGAPLRTMSQISGDARPAVAGKPPAAMQPLAQTTLSASASIIEEALTLRTRRWRAPLVVGVLALAGAGGYFLLSGRAASPPSATLSPEPAPAAPAPAPAATPPRAKPAPVVVSLTSDPSGARIVRERDGAVIGMTPYKQSWPAGDGVEKLRIEKDSFNAQNVIVPLDRGVDLSFTLAAVAAPHKRKPAAARAVAPASKAPAAPAPAALPASPPPSPPKPPPKAEPHAL